jgi:DNA-3-methyladenine glycosylase II
MSVVRKTRATSSRRTNDRADKVSQLSFRLTARAPFRLDLTVWTLRRRPDNAIDRWDGRFYRRILAFDGLPVEVSVRQTRPPDDPQLEVTAVCEQRRLSGLKARLTAILERTLGLQVDLSGFYEMARDDPKIGALVRRFNGFRPPRFPTVFEALVNAIACQQLRYTARLLTIPSLRIFTRVASKNTMACGFQAPALPRGHSSFLSPQYGRF